MVACFGLHDGYQLPRFSGDHVVEHRGRLDSFWLNRIGALVGEGTVTQLKIGGRGSQLVARGANLLVDGNPIALDFTDWNLAWFLCPRCGQRCRHVYLPELACRKCLKLDYSSRHRHRSVPGLARLKWLRRLIGVDERPFAPLPERPRHHLRYNRIAEEIRALEVGLVGHLGEINQVLERRIQRRRVK
jgi:hypothetical protein